LRKVAGLPGGILAFGNPRNLREVAQGFTLPRRIEADDAMVAAIAAQDTWLARTASLESAHRPTNPPQRRPNPLVDCLLGEDFVALARRARVDDPRLSSRELSDLRAWVRRFREEHSSKLPTTGLPRTPEPKGASAREWIEWMERWGEALRQMVRDVRDEARRRILLTTRVYICTIDSTPRLMSELEALLLEDKTEGSPNTIGELVGYLASPSRSVHQNDPL
jgi:hypothetical protein